MIAFVALAAGMVGSSVAFCAERRIKGEGKDKGDGSGLKLRDWLVSTGQLSSSPLAVPSIFLVSIAQFLSIVQTQFQRHPLALEAACLALSTVPGVRAALHVGGIRINHHRMQ